MNLNAKALHPNTQRDAARALSRFPSSNIYDNNLAQAIEMLHAVDASIDIIRSYKTITEHPLAITPKRARGIGIIEAPRGTLFHAVTLTEEGKVERSKVIVPTGQNQIGIEAAIKDWVSKNTDKSKEELSQEIQQIIRAYDPCMSCATHFLKLRITTS